MTFKQIIGDLQKKIYKPVYLLMGEEPYYIDKITDFIQDNVLNETEKTFNQTIIYGKDTDASAVVNAAKRYPMMSNYQVVIVKEAQHLKKIEDLQYYTDQALSSTILVLNFKYKKLDKRLKLYKSIDKNGIVFDSPKLYESKIPDWISSYVNEQNCTISPPASMLLTEFLGNDLSKITNEIGKLILTLPQEQKEISIDHIEKNIGISKDYNNFELNNAITKKDVLKAARIVQYFSKNPKDNPLIVTISMLYSHFSKVLAYHFTKDKSKQNIASKLKINPFFVQDYEKAAKAYNPAKVVNAIALLREYDMKSKGFGNTSTSDGDLLKELIYKIMH